MNKNLKVRRGYIRKSPALPKPVEVEMVVLQPETPIPSPLTPTPLFVNIRNGCDVCEGHIYDWLTLPLAPEEEFCKKIRPRALKRCARGIAQILFRIIHTYKEYRQHIESEYCVKLVEEANKYNSNWFQDRKIPAEHYQKFKQAERKFFLHALQKYETCSDSNALRAFVEDTNCLKRGVDIEEWLGAWIIILWEFIPPLHLEHQKLKPATGGGPAPGLRSFTPPPRPPQLRLPPIVNIPSVPSSPSDPSLQVNFELDELYS